MSKLIGVLFFALALAPAYAQVSSSASKIQTMPTVPSTCPGGGWVRVVTGAPNPGLYDCPTAGGAPRFLGDGGAVAVITMTTGAVDPSGSCTAPSSSNLSFYTQTATQELWACVATNTWKKALSTTNVGPYFVSGFVGALTTGVAASRPACSANSFYLATDTFALTECDGTTWSSALNPSGSIACLYETTANTQLCFDSGGNRSASVKTAAARTSNQYGTHVNSSGVLVTAQPAFSELSGSATVAQIPTATIGQKFFGTAAPGSVATNLPGDLYTDTTNHHEYVCNAPSGTAAPACTSVATAGWLQVDSTGGGGGLGYTLRISSNGTTMACGASLFFGDAGSNTGTGDNLAWRAIIPKDGTIKAISLNIYNPTSVTGPNADAVVAYILGASGTTPVTFDSGFAWPVQFAAVHRLTTGLSVSVVAGNLIGGKATASTCSSGAMTSSAISYVFYIE